MVMLGVVDLVRLGQLLEAFASGDYIQFECGCLWAVLIDLVCFLNIYSLCILDIV